MTLAQSEKLHELFEQYSKSMAEAAYRHVGDTDLAKDLVQEVFVLAAAKADVVCSHPNSQGWLFKTLHNVVMHEMDRAYHKREMLAENAKEQMDEVESDLPLNMEVYLPKGLEEEERKLILLRVREKLSHAEIAELLGMREATARQNVSRAIHKCRKLLEQDAVADGL